MCKKETKTPFEGKGKRKKKGQEEESYHLCGGNPLLKKKGRKKKSNINSALFAIALERKSRFSKARG